MYGSWRQRAGNGVSPAQVKHAKFASESPVEFLLNRIVGGCREFARYSKGVSV